MAEGGTTAQTRRRCFVVMGFGKKKDYATSRMLDLDKSYRLLIKPVVTEQGIECRRADEIRHSGAIDVPMYEELLGADVVIADLSTANPNALYELGIRHALRPRTTIVISESKLPYPFDLNHVLISSYTHLGDAIDYEEVERFRRELGETLATVMREQRTDSPVYTYLDLTPPSLGTTKAESGGDGGGEEGGSGPASAPKGSEPDDDSLAWLVEMGEAAIGRGEFLSAKRLFERALRFGPQGKAGAMIAQDPYLTQRLALATYKSKAPDEVSALEEAQRVLEPLLPEASNDPETVGLSGAIAKRLFDAGQGNEHLDRAIRFYERGYLLKNDSYNAINYAYLLDVRAGTALDGSEVERVADMVWANRIRREVLALCERDLAAIAARERPDAPEDALKQEQTARDREAKFWCLATKAEAMFGLGDLDGFARARAEAEAVPHAGWMMESFDGQIGRLRALMEAHGHLLAPPWPGGRQR
jgi:tetratricopeptide (TPR) repeat protein